MPFKPARCTIAKADRHLIIGTSARAPTPVAPPTATSRSKVSAWSKSGIDSEVQPGTLVYFPPGIPHRLRALGGPLDYFELRLAEFKTDVLSEEPLGLKWYYDPVGTGRCAGRVGPKLTKRSRKFPADELGSAQLVHFPYGHSARLSALSTGATVGAAGAATGMLLIDSAIARTGVCPRPPHSLRFLVRARGARHHVAAEVVAGRRRSYGDAADRQRDHANGGLNVELSLPIFRLALAVFIPWRGADGFDRRAGMAPALLVCWIAGGAGFFLFSVVAVELPGRSRPAPGVVDLRRGTQCRALSPDFPAGACGLYPLARG